MDSGKRSEQEDDSEMDATTDADGASSAGDAGGLRKRVTFDGSDDASDAEPRKRHSADASESQSSMGTVLVVITLAFVVFSSIGFYFNTSDHSNDVDPEWITEQLTKNVRIVRSKFPSQPKTIWAEFYSGIQKVLLEKPTEPSFFLLVHKGPEVTSSCMARKIGGVVHALIKPESADVLLVEGSTLAKTARSADNVAQVYRPLIEEHRVMVLKNLQLVPATFARGLGSFCNAAKPLVEQAVYIFTLKISDDVGNPKASAEKELNSLWSKLDKAALSPLVKCFAGGHVFLIHDEKNMSESC